MVNFCKNWNDFTGKECIVFEVGDPLVEWCLIPSQKVLFLGLGSGGQFSSENLFWECGPPATSSDHQDQTDSFDAGLMGGGTPELEQRSKPWLVVSI